MPIAGKVLAVNRKLLQHPNLIQRFPYEAGWVLRVRPRAFSKSKLNLLSGAAAGAWLDAARTSITRRLTPALGAVAHDGGEWAAGFGDRLNDTDWQDLKRDLFPTVANSDD
jgi:hypothetical protein